MILVDTSVWIDHLRRPIARLRSCLAAKRVLCHDMVIGELACGNLAEREQVLRRLRGLPRIEPLPAGDVLDLIEMRRFMGRGIGYVDANLLASVLARKDAALWTHDASLGRLAEELGVAHTAQGGS